MKGTGELLTGTDLNRCLFRQTPPLRSSLLPQAQRKEKQILSVISNNHRICSETLTFLQELSCLILLNSN